MWQLLARCFSKSTAVVFHLISIIKRRCPILFSFLFLRCLRLLFPQIPLKQQGLQISFFRAVLLWLQSHVLLFSSSLNEISFHLFRWLSNTPRFTFLEHVPYMFIKTQLHDRHFLCGLLFLTNGLERHRCVPKISIALGLLQCSLRRSFENCSCWTWCNEDYKSTV